MTVFFDCTSTHVGWGPSTSVDCQYLFTDTVVNYSIIMFKLTSYSINIFILTARWFSAHVGSLLCQWDHRYWAHLNSRTQLGEVGYWSWRVCDWCEKICVFNTIGRLMNKNDKRDRLKIICGTTKIFSPQSSVPDRTLLPAAAHSMTNAAHAAMITAWYTKHPVAMQPSSEVSAQHCMLVMS
jgi:hypothetical protein